MWLTLLTNKYLWLALGLAALLLVIKVQHMELSDLRAFKDSTVAMAKRQAEINAEDVRHRTEITKDTEKSYEDHIAALNSRIARLRADANHPSAVSPVPGAASGPDGSTASTGNLPPEGDALGCPGTYALEAAKLEALQGWVKGQQSVSPAP